MTNHNLTPLEKLRKRFEDAVAKHFAGYVQAEDLPFLDEALLEIEKRDKLIKEMTELLIDLDAVLKTAMHNGHHDLIARVSEMAKPNLFAD